MEIIIIALLVIAIVMEIVILSKANTKKDDKSEVLLDSLKDMKKDQDTLKIDVIKEISEGVLLFRFAHVVGGRIIGCVWLVCFAHMAVLSKKSHAHC